MFYCNVNESEHGKSHVTTESIRIELIAGGLSREQTRYIMSKIDVNANFKVRFVLRLALM